MYDIALYNFCILISVKTIYLQQKTQLKGAEASRGFIGPALIKSWSPLRSHLGSQMATSVLGFSSSFNSVLYYVGLSFRIYIVIPYCVKNNSFQFSIAAKEMSLSFFLPPTILAKVSFFPVFSG